MKKNFFGKTASQDMCFNCYLDHDILTQIVVNVIKDCRETHNVM